MGNTFKTWLHHLSNANQHVDKEILDVTVILTVWKRDNLIEQISAILNQNVRCKSIWIYHCKNYMSTKLAKIIFPHISIIHSDVNFKYFGRFSIAQYVESKYIWIVDDDVIPSSNWLKYGIENCEKHKSIVSCTGRIIPFNNYFPEKLNNVEKYFVGDRSTEHPFNYCLDNTKVDFGCNSWIFKTEWLKYFWQIPPFTLETGEDIHLSASLKILGDVPTLVPIQTDLYNNGNLKKYYGFDKTASWKEGNFLIKRSEILKYFINNNHWLPLEWK